MPEQILLQGKIQGTEEFLLAGLAEGRSARSAGEDLLTGKSQWITLLSEALPRALLNELGLARILLGSSGGGQFLVVLPDTARAAAEEFLQTARRHVLELSRGRVQLLWSLTENLGDWMVVRKRLNEELLRRRSTPLAATPDAFQPAAAQSGGIDPYFSGQLGQKLRESTSVG